MLTPDEQTEWDRQVERRRAYVKDDPNPVIQDTATIAVDAELTALRRRNAWLEGYLAASDSDELYGWPRDWRRGNDGESYPPWDEDVEWEKKGC